MKNTLSIIAGLLIAASLAACGSGNASEGAGPHSTFGKHAPEKLIVCEKDNGCQDFVCNNKGECVPTPVRLFSN